MTLTIQLRGLVKVSLASILLLHFQFQKAPLVWGSTTTVGFYLFLLTCYLFVITFKTCSLHKDFSNARS